MGAWIEITNIRKKDKGYQVAHYIQLWLTIKGIGDLVGIKSVLKGILNGTVLSLPYTNVWIVSIS